MNTRGVEAGGKEVLEAMEGAVTRHEQVQNDRRHELERALARADAMEVQAKEAFAKGFEMGRMREKYRWTWTEWKHVLVPSGYHKLFRSTDAAGLF